jgi:hypothetical protein
VEALSAAIICQIISECWTFNKRKEKDTIFIQITKLDNNKCRNEAESTIFTCLAVGGKVMRGFQKNFTLEDSRNRHFCWEPEVSKDQIFFCTCFRPVNMDQFCKFPSLFIDFIVTS